MMTEAGAASRPAAEYLRIWAEQVALVMGQIAGSPALCAVPSDLAWLTCDGRFAAVLEAPMNLLKSVETTIANLVEGTFGRMFRSEVRPMELARKLVREFVRALQAI